MGEQSTSSGFDSTLAPGPSRGQSENETTTVESTAAEVRNPPASQSTVASNFAAAIPSQQDPRSSAGSTNGSQSPPAVGVTTPPMAYQPSQGPTQSCLLPNALTPAQPLEPQPLQPSPEPQHPQKHRHHSPKQQIRQRKQQQHPTPVRPAEHAHPSLPLPQHSFRHYAPSPQIPEPPITRATLSELDVGKIIHNPKLRHDINYDPELHFRPNVDGEKGARKTEKARQFWNTLRDELIQFVMSREEFLSKQTGENEWSLPSLLNAVKDIIQTLVPARDRELLDEGLNVPLLMQQFNRGVVDLEKLASWLSSVLKLHCAPMRDDWVDVMYQELSRGNRENDMDELVRGLTSLLSVLEAMKLDVANHQIRCLRPLLIEDTVNFEQRFFRKRIENGRMSTTAAQKWYEQTKAGLETPGIRHQQAFGETTAFFSGLTQLLMPSVEAKKVPNTFLFDEERILKLRLDMLDAIYLEICMRIYDEASEAISSSARSRQAALAIPAYLAHAGSQTGSDFDFNTPPTTGLAPSPSSSRPCSINFSACGSDTSSPRNSMTPSNNGIPLPSHQSDYVEARLQAQELYTRLVALLQTAPQGVSPAQRWSDLGPKMAVEIFRVLSSMQAQAVSLEEIERRLETAMVIGSPLQQEVERTFRARLLSALARRMKDFRTMPSVGLFVVAAGGRIHPTPGRSSEPVAAAFPVTQETRDIDPRQDGGVEDMATRLAHLGILHWRVWSSIVYECQPEEDDEMLLM